MKSYSILLPIAITIAACSPAQVNNSARTPAQEAVLDEGGGDLYHIQAPSAVFIDWDTPSKLVWSFLRSEIKKYSQEFFTNTLVTAMGHGMTHFKCTTRAMEGKPAKEYDIWTGMTGAANSKDLNLDEGIDLMFKNYDDGHLQTNDEVIRFLSVYKGRKEKSLDGDKYRLRPHFFKYKISGEQCEKIGEFYDKYASIQLGTPNFDELASRAAKAKLYYGFLIDPAKVWSEYKADPSKEYLFGGGCTSVASSFVKLADKFLPLYDQYWIRNLEVALKYTRDGKRLLLTKNKDWTPEGEETKTISFYDPEKMWRFMDGVISCMQFENKEANFGVKVMKDTCTPEVREWVKTNAAALSKAKLQTEEKATVTKVKRRRHKEVEISKTMNYDIDIDGVEIDVSKIPVAE